MTVRSAEIEAITRRIVAAIFSADGKTVASFLSSSDPLLFCGSAHGELWEGQALRDTYAAHVGEFPHVDLFNQRVQAWENGSSGWAHWIGECTVSGRTVEDRMTFVYVLEHGMWKIQHLMNSISISNIEMLGYEHKAHQALIEAARNAALEPPPSGLCSVMFTDVAGSSVIAESIGDRAWAGIVQQHIGLVGDEIARERGTLVKSLGDGTMSRFSSARAAMAAAIAIQRRLAALTGEPRIEARIGIHTGDVVQSGDDFFGTVVNKAARIAAFARPGEIRVSEATRIMVGGASEFAFFDTARVALKGLEGEHVIYRLEPGP